MINFLTKYLDNFAKKNFSEQFLELWAKNNWGFEEYKICSTEYEDVLERRVTKHTIIFLIALIFSLTLLTIDNGVLSLISFAIALRSYFKSNKYMQAIEQISINSMLARLINEKKVN
jgi:ssDNA-specific exonuclease RecJ